MRGEDALALLAIYLKQDPTYRPIKDITGRRWYLRTALGEFETLASGTSSWSSPWTARIHAWLLAFAL
jgi:hypothetical protein